jgi:hypothetical protein
MMEGGTGGVALLVVDDIPVLGVKFGDRARALQAARELVQRAKVMGPGGQNPRVDVRFEQQKDGRFTLAINCGPAALACLCGLDELLLRRFRKAMKKNVFILTSFVERSDGQLECLVLTEGLGVVVYGGGRGDVKLR